MQLKDLGTTLARRWYLTLAGLLATAGLCIGTFTAVPPTYQTTADVVLLPPKTSVGTGGNPYLYLGGLQQAVDVLTRALTSDASRTELLGAVGAGEYDVVPDLSTSGPILIVTGTGTTSTIADSARNAVLDRVPTTLVQLQTALSVATDSQITSMVLTADEKPKLILKTRLRAVAAAGVLGLIASAMFIGFVDGLLASRALRRSLHATRANQPDDPEADADPLRGLGGQPAADGGGAGANRQRSGQADNDSGGGTDLSSDDTNMSGDGGSSTSPAALSPIHARADLPSVSASELDDVLGLPAPYRGSTRPSAPR